MGSSGGGGARRQRVRRQRRAGGGGTAGGIGGGIGGDGTGMLGLGYVVGSLADLMGFFSPLRPLVLFFFFSFTGDYLNLLG